MELAVISDSHIPERKQALPDRFRERIAAAVSTAMEAADDGEITSFDATIESEAGLVLRGEE